MEPEWLSEIYIYSSKYSCKFIKIKCWKLTHLMSWKLTLRNVVMVTIVSPHDLGLEIGVDSVNQSSILGQHQDFNFFGFFVAHLYYRGKPNCLYVHVITVQQDKNTDCRQNGTLLWWHIYLLDILPFQVTCNLLFHRVSSVVRERL